MTLRRRRTPCRRRHSRPGESWAGCTTRAGCDHGFSESSPTSAATPAAKKWVVEVSVGVPEELPAVSSEDRTLRSADLRRAISHLGHDDRLVVVLYFYLDMPVDEVATVAGTSVGATRARLYRAIKKLRPDVAMRRHSGE